jgi:hypothetical protein
VFVTTIQFIAGWTVLSILSGLAVARIFAINPPDEDRRT